MSPATRTYGQRCGLALSLDLLGERWTMLVIRELTRGPKRFKDLQENLEGIGANLLSNRLKALEEAGVIEHVTLPPPVSVAAYAMTERGRTLQPILEDLALWGFGLMPPFDSSPDLTTRAAWAAMTMKASMDRDERRPPPGIFAFEVGDESFWLEVKEDSSELIDGAPGLTPDATLKAELDDFVRIAVGVLPIEDSPASIEGDREALLRLLETFSLPYPGSAEAPQTAR